VGPKRQKQDGRPQVSPFQQQLPNIATATSTTTDHDIDIERGVPFVLRAAASRRNSGRGRHRFPPAAARALAVRSARGKSSDDNNHEQQRRTRATNRGVVIEHRVHNRRSSSSDHHHHRARRPQQPQGRDGRSRRAVSVDGLYCAQGHRGCNDDPTRMSPRREHSQRRARLGGRQRLSKERDGADRLDQRQGATW
jgi:hypothetical protein